MSPIVSLEAITITSSTEAHKGRYVATVCIPGDYLNTDSDKEVIIILKGRLSYILVNIDPKVYMKYVVLEKVVKVLYLRLQKALYG